MREARSNKGWGKGLRGVWLLYGVLLMSSGCQLLTSYSFEEDSEEIRADLMDADQGESKLDQGMTANRDMVASQEEMGSGVDACASLSCSGTCSNGACDCTDDADCSDDEVCANGSCVSCQRVAQCFECPAGTTRVSPDVMECNPILCQDNERVLAHTCTPCGSGTYNLSGDDASQGDTRCDEPCAAIVGEACGPADGVFLKASNTGSGDRFGASVAISGEVIAVGAPFEDAEGEGRAESGAVYLFERIAGRWTQVAYLKAPNPEASALFGSSVALDGETLVVGSPGEGIDRDVVSGAVHVFEKLDDRWRHTSSLSAEHVMDGARFGAVVSLSGSRIAVGAPGESAHARGVDEMPDDTPLPESGAVYLFEWEGEENAWRAVSYIKASNADPQDHFGAALWLDGTRLAVGAPDEDGSTTSGELLDNATLESGAVYLFEASDGAWRETAYLKASNRGPGDRFGSAVHLVDNLLAVGAPHEDSDANRINGDEQSDRAMESGAVYLFEHTSQGGWSQDAYLKASNAGAGDHFGASVWAGERRMVVGASGESSLTYGLTGVGVGGEDRAPDSGALYVYVQNPGGKWTERQSIKSLNTGAGDRFGHAVAISRGDLLVGAALESSDATGVDGSGFNDGALQSGAAYVYGVD